MSQLYLIEARPSAFSSERFLALMAARGLVEDQSAPWSVAVVPRAGDTFELGNLQVECTQVVLRVCPEQGQPVARCWFKVKP